MNAFRELPRSVRTSAALFAVVLLMLAGVLAASAGQGGVSAAATGSANGAEPEDLRVLEHRISVVQKDDPNTLSVQDEFWIRNAGEEPYIGRVYNWLPDEISTRDGMTCMISETGGHRCYGWKREGNRYHWGDSSVVLPRDYGKEFDLNITAGPVNDSGSPAYHLMHIDPSSPAVEQMVEKDEWGWNRKGFERGWKTTLNFTVKNDAGRDEVFDIATSGVPAGLTLELYADTDEDGSLGEDDTRIGYDGDRDGDWDPAPDHDADENGVPDIPIPSGEEMTFFVFIRAEYMVHFFTLYDKEFTAPLEGMLTLEKRSVYDTSRMRIFVVPDEEKPIKSDKVSFAKRGSGEDMYYYGEWDGEGGEELSLSFKGGTNEEEGGYTLTIVLISAAVILLGAGTYVKVRRKGKREGGDVREAGRANAWAVDRRERSRKRARGRGRRARRARGAREKVGSAIDLGEDGRTEGERDGSGDVSGAADGPGKEGRTYEELMERRKGLIKIIGGIQKKTFDDELEEALEMEMCREFERKLGRVERELKGIRKRKKLSKRKRTTLAGRKKKYIKALMRLEEDRGSGVLDDEVYEELKEQYFLRCRKIECSLRSLDKR